MKNSTVQLIFDLVDKSQKNIYRRCTHPDTNIFAFSLKSRGVEELGGLIDFMCEDVSF